MFENLLLVQMDQGTAKDGKSKLMALDAATGKTVWEVAREVPNSWPSPIVIDSAGPRSDHHVRPIRGSSPTCRPTARRSGGRNACGRTSALRRPLPTGSSTWPTSSPTSRPSAPTARAT